MRFMGHTYTWCSSGAGCLQLQGDGEPHGRSSSHSSAPQKALPSARPKSDNEIWQKFPCAGSVAKKRSCTACINSSDLCSRPWFTLWLKTSAGLLTNWNQISSAAWYWSLFNIKAQNWLALINNKKCSPPAGCQATFSEPPKCTVVLSPWPLWEETRLPHAPDKQYILMLL